MIFSPMINFYSCKSHSSRGRREQSSHNTRSRHSVFIIPGLGAPPTFSMTYYQLRMRIFINRDEISTGHTTDCDGTVDVENVKAGVVCNKTRTFSTPHYRLRMRSAIATGRHNCNGTANVENDQGQCHCM